MTNHPCINMKEHLFLLFYCDKFYRLKCLHQLHYRYLLSNILKFQKSNSVLSITESSSSSSLSNKSKNFYFSFVQENRIFFQNLKQFHYHLKFPAKHQHNHFLPVRLHSGAEKIMQQKH